MPDELWMEVCDTVQETGIKTIPKKKKYKKAKWLSNDALQIAVIRREAKKKGEKKRYPFECRVPKNKKEREESLLQISVEINRGKKIEWERLEISSRGNSSCINGNNKGQKWYGPNRSRRYEKVAGIHRKTLQKRSS